MKILILGQGGREHALAWRLANDSQVSAVYVAPGNSGMVKTEDVSIVSIQLSERAKIKEFCKEEKIDFVLVGPEVPLSEGISDYLESNNINVLGPKQNAAEIESSKIFSKLLMKEFDIPTAAFYVFNLYEEAKAFLNNRSWKHGIVLKADELAAGKGVVVAKNKNEALSALNDFFNNPDFPGAGKRILIEEMLYGEELSVFVLCDGDGENFHILGKACDYKRLKDNDVGPNTGGMGCYIPSKWPSKNCENKIIENIIKPTLKGMKEKGRAFKGILFVGLMIDKEIPNVIEFNCRFGDPETQVLMPMLEGPLGELFLSASKGNIDKNISSKVKVSTEKSAVHIVLASEGYPGLNGTKLTTGQTILEATESPEGIHVFYAGVEESIGNTLVNSGGRVLGITGIGADVKEARDMAYKFLPSVLFNGAQWRNDIALKERL